MNNREIDYYIKDLPFDARQEIFKRLNEINSTRVKQLLEKPEGYPSFKRIGYSGETILAILQQATSRFQNVNECMIENERYPLFDNPSDSYDSALKYVEILKKKTPEELMDKFGCSWKEYVPKILKKNEREIEEH